MFSQGTKLKVSSPFQFKTGAGRIIVAKLGDAFWITANARTHPSRVNAESAMICRHGSGSIVTGWLFPESTIRQYFSVSP